MSSARFAVIVYTEADGFKVASPFHSMMDARARAAVHLADMQAQGIAVKKADTEARFAMWTAYGMDGRPLVQITTVPVAARLLADWANERLADAKADAAPWVHNNVHSVTIYGHDS